MGVTLKFTKTTQRHEFIGWKDPKGKKIKAFVRKFFKVNGLKQAKHNQQKPQKNHFLELEYYLGN